MARSADIPALVSGLTRATSRHTDLHYSKNISVIEMGDLGKLQEIRSEVTPGGLRVRWSSVDAAGVVTTNDTKPMGRNGLTVVQVTGDRAEVFAIGDVDLTGNVCHSAPAIDYKKVDILHQDEVSPRRQERVLTDLATILGHI